MLFLFFFTLAFVIHWVSASWTSFSVVFFNPGLRDTLGICLLDQHCFSFFIYIYINWGHSLDVRAFGSETSAEQHRIMVRAQGYVPLVAGDIELLHFF